MRPKSKVRILVIILSLLVLGLATTLITDLFTKSTTSPTNIIYSGDEVLYYHNPLVSVTQSEKRGFPFISQTKVVTKYVNEEMPVSAYGDREIPSSTITVQGPGATSTGSNSFIRILLTWQFYTDVLIWAMIWLLLGYSIKSVRHKVSHR